MFAMPTPRRVRLNCSASLPAFLLLMSLGSGTDRVDTFEGGFQRASDCIVAAMVVNDRDGDRWDTIECVATNVDAERELSEALQREAGVRDRDTY